MTRPSANSLLLDGDTVKLRLLAERSDTGSAVHIDWLRFTCQVRNSPLPPVGRLFFIPPFSEPKYANEVEANESFARIVRVLHDLPNPDRSVGQHARELAIRVANRLGRGQFVVAADIRKGHDFYKFRWSIERAGVEVGWVGFLASAESPKQQAQAKTLHVNLYGMACTFADARWRVRMAKLIELTSSVITRCDLALDFFDGIGGGLERVQADYNAGLMSNRGKRPKCNMVGDWCNGKGRSFYFGSKQAGKQTNIYEKGFQLYGEKDATNWHRIELRYGNKLRVIPIDILRRPSDFFAGASDWHKSILSEHGPALLLEGKSVEVSPQKIQTTARLAIETVKAEVSRNIRWLLDTAAPSVALAFQHLGDDFLELVTGKKAPGRLEKFSSADVVAAYKNAFSHVTGSRSGGGVEPAFAH